MLDILINKKNNMEVNTQTLRGEMQRMGLDLQVGQGALKEELKKAEGKMTEDISTIRVEVNGLEEKVKEVRSAMEAGKEEMANGIKTAVQEIDKLGQGMKEVKEGQDQIKGEMEKNTRTIEQLKEEQRGNKKGIGSREGGV